MIFHMQRLIIYIMLTSNLIVKYPGCEGVAVPEGWG